MIKLTAYEIFSRDNLKGDMFPLLRHLKKPILIDFIILDTDKNPNELSYLREDAEKLRSANKEMIQQAADSISALYSKYTDGRLNFKLGRIDRYFIPSAEEGRLPRDNCGIGNKFVIRVNPLIYGGHCGQYHNYGLIDVLPEAIIHKFNHKLLTHEIGHGIFGNGHHSPEIGCLMDESWLYQADTLCEEDARTLRFALDLA